MINGMYEADAGSITLIHKTGARFSISNNDGDGRFCYVVLTKAEFAQGLTDGTISKNYILVDAWLPDGKDWKVMDYDCYKSYSDKGTELNPGYCAIYRIKTEFFFVQ